MTRTLARPFFNVWFFLVLLVSVHATPFFTQFELSFTTPSSQRTMLFYLLWLSGIVVTCYIIFVLLLSPADSLRNRLRDRKTKQDGIPTSKDTGNATAENKEGFAEDERNSSGEEQPLFEWVVWIAAAFVALLSGYDEALRAHPPTSEAIMVYEFAAFRLGEGAAIGLLTIFFIKFYKAGTFP
jgi:hypothetical protein